MSLGLMIDKKTKRFVSTAVSVRSTNVFFNLSLSVLGLRLFDQDPIAVGQQEAKNQSENYHRRHHTEMLAEHALMLDEDKNPR